MNPSIPCPEAPSTDRNPEGPSPSHDLPVVTRLTALFACGLNRLLDGFPTRDISRPVLPPPAPPVNFCSTQRPADTSARPRPLGSHCESKAWQAPLGRLPRLGILDAGAAWPPPRHQKRPRARCHRTALPTSESASRCSQPGLDSASNTLREKGHLPRNQAPSTNSVSKRAVVQYCPFGICLNPGRSLGIGNAISTATHWPP